MTFRYLARKFQFNDPDAHKVLDNCELRTPFFTAEYLRAMRVSGREPWLIIRREGEVEIGIAAGFVSRGKLSTGMEFVSLPPSAADPEFWEEVVGLCRKIGVTDLVAGSFASVPFNLPPLPGEISRSLRQEFVLSLDNVDLASLLHLKHRQSLKKALKANLEIRRTRKDLDWLADHVALIRQSADRHLKRGETVSVQTDTAAYRILIESGAAELFQAIRDREIVSSVIVLTSPQSAYLQTSGTRLDAMSYGASHFLLYHVAAIMQEEGRRNFNLGGAPENSMLARFKLRFGAEAVAVPAATCYIGPRWKKKLLSAYAMAASDRKKLLTAIIGSSSQWLVYMAERDTSIETTQISIPGARLQHLSAGALSNLPSPADDPAFRNRQLTRLERFGQSYAYGVYVGDELAHVSWLLPGPESRREGILELDDSEAEITACETFSAFRGRGIYGYAVHQLLLVARANGFDRVYMKILETNTASLRGIEKTGLSFAGSIRVIKPPLPPSRMVVKRRLSPPGTTRSPRILRRPSLMRQGRAE